MDKILVYDVSGSPKLYLSEVESAVRSSSYMSYDMVTIGVIAEAVVNVTVGDSIVVDGKKYRCNQVPMVEKIGYSIYRHTFVFESVKYDLANVTFVMPDATIGDYFTGNLKDYIQGVVDNANRVYPNTWSKNAADYDDDVVAKWSETMTEDYSGQSCLAALQAICTQYGCEFYVEEGTSGNVIRVRDNGATSGVTFRYGAANELVELVREATASENIVTRLYVYGSTENLHAGYRHTRLCLPNKTKAQSYIQNSQMVARYGVKEGVVMFEDIMPHCQFTVETAFTDRKKIAVNLGFDLKARWVAYADDGGADFAEWCVIYNYDDSDPDSLTRYASAVGTYKYLVDGEAKVTFTTGALAGYSFGIVAAQTVSPYIYLKELTDESINQTLPNESYHPARGDKFNLTDIRLPLSAVTSAESELATKGQEEYENLTKYAARYSVTINPHYTEVHGDFSIALGDYVHVIDAGMGVDRNIKVIQYDKNLITGTVAYVLSDIKHLPKNSVGAGNYNTASVDIIESVGVTELTSTFEPNYGGFRNKVNIGAGTFTVSTLPGRQWSVSARMVDDLVQNFGYTLYARCSRTQRYCDIVFVVSTGEKDIFPMSDSWYYFRIGRLSDAASRYRVLSLEAGVLISNGWGTRGAIVTADGGVIVDMDNGEIGSNARITINGGSRNLANLLEGSISVENGNAGTVEDFNADVVATLKNVVAVMKANFGLLAGTQIGYKYTQQANGVSLSDEDLEVDSVELDRIS